MIQKQPVFWKKKTTKPRVIKNHRTEEGEQEIKYSGKMLLQQNNKKNNKKK